jgi:hypothetical protein
MKIPDNVINKVLYKRAYDKVTGIYGQQTSAYRSMAIVTEYKRLGGRYKADSRKKSTRQPGLKRWLREQWIMVRPYVLQGKVVPCGTHSRRRHACRPLVRVTKKTPPTIDEILAKHGKTGVVRLAKSKKQKGSEQVRIDWKNFSLK